MRDKMKTWREENYRNGEHIIEVGEELLNEHASKLGDDSKFIIHINFSWARGWRYSHLFPRNIPSETLSFQLVSGEVYMCLWAAQGFTFCNKNCVSHYFLWLRIFPSAGKKLWNVQFFFFFTIMETCRLLSTFFLYRQSMYSQIHLPLRGTPANILHFV